MGGIEYSRRKIDYLELFNIGKTVSKEIRAYISTKVESRLVLLRVL